MTLPAKLRAKVKAHMAIAEALKDCTAISGGLAIHIMKPPHEEGKGVLFHDHSDIDFFVIDQRFFTAIKDLGFRKTFSKYTGKDFIRYFKKDVVDEVRISITIDGFLQFDIPYIEFKGFKLLHPSILIKLYEGKKHHPYLGDAKLYRENHIRFLRIWMQENRIEPIEVNYPWLMQ